MLPNYVVWFVGVDVEFVLSCRFNPLGRHSDESEQETLDSVCGLDSTAENGEDGPYYLAVLIAYQLTAKSQVGVDYRGKNTVKFVQNEKYSAKSSDFLRFLLYLCYVIDDFACLDLQH